MKINLKLLQADAIEHSKKLAEVIRKVPEDFDGALMQFESGELKLHVLNNPNNFEKYEVQIGLIYPHFVKNEMTGQMQKVNAMGVLAVVEQPKNVKPEQLEKALRTRLVELFSDPTDALGQALAALDWEKKNRKSNIQL